MGISDDLDRLRDLHISGKLKEHEYDAAREAVLKGDTALFEELVKRQEDGGDSPAE